MSGIPPEQISLGIPTYGRWFGLADGNQNTIGSSIIGSSITLAYSDVNFVLFQDFIFNSFIILDL
jgi:GH18 family chitinase